MHFFHLGDRTSYHFLFDFLVYRRRDEQHKRYFDDGPSPENEPIRFVERTPPQRRHSRHRRSSRYQYRLPISPLVTAPVYSRQSNSRTPHDSGFDHSTPHR